jgi:phenylacetate-CoA ligase
MAERLRECGLSPEATQGVESLHRLLILRKDALPAAQGRALPFGGLLGAPVATLRRIYVSPGPIYGPEPRGRDYWGLAPALHAAGFRRGDIVLVTFAFHLTPAGHMMDAALDALGGVTVPGGTGNTDVQARALADLSITGVVGTPSFVLALLERARALGGRLAVEVALVSGEYLTAGLRARAREEFGVRVTQAYATADVGVIAYECPAANGLHVADRVAVEVVNPETGRPADPGMRGEVVVSLLEPPYALLRFGTGDLAAWEEGECPCGRTAPRLTGVLGRVGDAVKIRGLFVHPSEADRVVLTFPEVVRYQIAVTRPGPLDEARLLLELRPGADAAAVCAAVAAAVHEGLRLRMLVEAAPAGSIGEGAPRISDRRDWR